MAIGSTHQADITILNLYAPSNIGLKIYNTQKLAYPKKEIDSIRVEEFNTLLSEIDRIDKANRKHTSKNMEDLKHTTH